LVLHEFKGGIRSLTLCFDCKIILFITSFILALGFLAVGFRWLVLASFVLERLRALNRVTKREVLELKIPQQPYLNYLIDRYQKDKEQVVKEQKCIEELEKQIDDLVYKLYDITYAERRIIKDYLKKF
jgi:adenylate kinase family enzyme